MGSPKYALCEKVHQHSAQEMTALTTHCEDVNKVFCPN